VKQLGSLLVVAFGSALVAFACGGDAEPGDDSGGEAGNGGSNGAASGKGGQTHGGTAGGGRGGTAGRAGAGSGGGGRNAAGGTGGSPVECSSAINLSGIEGKACNDEAARCDVGEECCCGECSPELVCSCNDGRWDCYYTDFCAFTENCGGAGGQGGQAGQGS
jgi:hypothetical protein